MRPIGLFFVPAPVEEVDEALVGSGVVVSVTVTVDGASSVDEVD